MYSLKRKSLRIKSRITILREAIQAPVIIQVTDETPVTGARGIITVREITAIITVRGITITGDTEEIITLVVREQVRIRVREMTEAKAQDSVRVVMTADSLVMTARRYLKGLRRASQVLTA